MGNEQTNKHKYEILVDLTDVVKALALVLAWLAGLAFLWWMTGWAGEVVTRWWAALATMILPVAVGVTAWIATLSAREHLAGLERGMDASQRAVEGMGRSLGAAVNAVRGRGAGELDSCLRGNDGNGMLLEMRDNDWSE